jgi:hypothetical protein
VCNPLYSQWYSPSSPRNLIPWAWENQWSWWNTADTLLPKQFINESRNSETEEWKNEAKYLKSYDHKGRLIAERHFYSNENGIIELGREQEYKYDQRGFIIYYLIREWSNPAEIEFERLTERSYDENGRILQARDWTKYFTDNKESEIIRNYEYDSEGRQTLSQTIFDNTLYDGTKSGFRCEIDISGEACEKIFTEICSRLNSNNWIPEYQYELIGEESCGTMISNGYRYINNQWSYDYGEKIDREFDESGNAIKFDSYIRNSKEEDWAWEFESVFEYDGKGNIVFYSHINPSADWKISIHQVYDEKNRPISIIEEYYDPVTNELLYSNEGNYEYDQKNNLVLEEVISQYDSLPGGNSYDFNSYNYSFAEFDEHNKLTRLEEFESNSEYYYDENGQYQLEERSVKFETLYTYRCDHVLTELIKTVLEANNQWFWQAGNQERYLLDYYQRPDCFDSQSPERNKVTVFPNPATNYVHIYSPEYLGLTQIRIMDGMGRIVFEDQKELSNYFSVDVSMILDGMYILNLDNGKINQSRKIAIQK